MPQRKTSRSRTAPVNPAHPCQSNHRRKRLLQQTQTIQQRQNELAKLSGQAKREKNEARFAELQAEGKTLKESVGGLEKQIKQVEDGYLSLSKAIRVGRW